MGKLMYENTVTAEFEDRALMHLQAVISTKLRRQEAFPLTWKDDPRVSHGRTTVWIHPSSQLVFKYHGRRTPSMNERWLEALMRTASSPDGLHLVPEPGAGGAAGR
ncbi:DUF7882 family protein [Microbacterium sp. HJ5]